MIDFSLITIELVVLSLGAIGFLGFLLKWHNDSNNTFTLQHVVVDESGKISLSKLGQLIALLTSTWIIIYQTRAGLLSEWLFTGYMIAWAGTNLLSKYINSKSSEK